MPTVESPPTVAEVRDLLAAHGIDHVGFTGSEILAEARDALRRRKAAGLHDGMQFTYRNPERSTDPTRALEGARSVIVAARSYCGSHDVAPAPDLAVPARVARYAWVDHYAALREGLRELADRLRAAGHRAVAFADDNSLVDRAVAHRAGLGWYGKNANLLLPGAGSFFVLGSVVTTARYEPATSPVADGCGSCRRCIDACPTGAIIDAGVVDGARCLSWVGQKRGPMSEPLRAALGDRMYGCDDCQDVCPITVRFAARHTVEVEAPEAWVDALAVLDAGDDELLAELGRWYIADRDVRWLRRNALVIVGNVCDPWDHRAIWVLDRYRAGDDPILAEHAEWALARIAERRHLARVP